MIRAKITMPQWNSKFKVRQEKMGCKINIKKRKKERKDERKNARTKNTYCNRTLERTFRLISEHPLVFNVHNFGPSTSK